MPTAIAATGDAMPIRSMTAYASGERPSGATVQWNFAIPIPEPALPTSALALGLAVCRVRRTKRMRGGR